MAQLTKSRARKPLAESPLSFHWSDMEEGERYNASITGEEDSRYKLSLEPKEALAFMSFIATDMTTDRNQTQFQRVTLSERLRALADKLDLNGS